ncbi:hypothetical protein P175DRAFT_0483194 [Aspergillus ochraceoroseus IBT 24754]|uniref:Zn(2)-C6 fungal-type domain-containing protein n=2 Tax=Aspergillus ochraceoroseus TaxID=138278 RepID=A0A2T5LTJ4_9EURO|nr:uncharacterized protein P175DRAFT_0483194 [Aspergillus ochraceoroseus IBT 24754]KKK22788.1 hypothetical protein AOCH_006373 [Aspergillus ochraceoroseus]PTU19599.1 hypothetical protein P175DRAFT_0483194 [Aspergillus ochraceoroseus IBT 24754]
MVYRGKLSPACGWCRIRRLKCDQQRPSCSQCIRGNRLCYGYRDVSAGRFCDQSAEVRGKHSEDEETSIQVFSAVPFPTASPVKRRRLGGQSEFAMLQQISIPLNDQGTAFILAHYVGGSGLNQARGHLGFLPKIMSSQSGLAITTSINAVGLAALSNIHMSPQLMLTARQEYVKALAETNIVLSDQVLSRSNATLTAVMLLSMYEVMTCQGPPLIDRWLDHVEGFARLVELRGLEQLEDAVGMELFSQFRMNIVLGNIWLKAPTPAWLITYSNDAFARRDPKERPSDELFFLLAQVCDLCATMRDGLLQEPVTVIRTALQLDAELVSRAMSVDSTWHYTVIEMPPTATPQPAHIYGDQYHLYPNIDVISWWNYYRVARLILHQLVASFSDLLGRRHAATSREYRQSLAQSVTLSRQLAEDICASVPYFFGATETFPGKGLGGGRTVGVIRTIWPLFIAADCIGTTPSMMVWISQCLMKIGRSLGIQQAVAMAELLSGDKHLDWLTVELEKVGIRERI